MKPNILFVYGEDSYRSRQKLNAIKQKYIDASLGDTNLAIIDGEQVTVDELVRQLYAIPFLAKTRLVVITNLLTNGKTTIQEKMLKIIDQIPQTTVALFYEQGTPDRRIKLFKELSQRGQTQAFALLSPPHLLSWIKQFVKNLNGSIDQPAVELLADSIGPDLWRLDNELKKLILFDKNVSLENVKALVDLPIQVNIFNLLDRLGERDVKKALLELGKLIKKGENGLYILTMLQRAIRNLALVKSQQKLSTVWRIHPYVLQKTRVQVNNFSNEDLKNLYGELARIDWLAKTGKIEPETGVALFVAQATRRL